MEGGEGRTRKKMKEEDDWGRDYYAQFDIYYEKADPSPHVSLNFCGQSVPFIVDTGSLDSYISREQARSLNLTIEDTSYGDEYVMGELSINKKK